eukprot:scaffold4732_cov37-Prasinocladus_malaysianus.AAC.1
MPDKTVSMHAFDSSHSSSRKLPLVVKSYTLACSPIVTHVVCADPAQLSQPSQPSCDIAHVTPRHGDVITCSSGLSDGDGCERKHK